MRNDIAELTIEVFCISGRRFIAEFSARRSGNSLVGGTGRDYASALEAVEDLLAHMKTMANPNDDAPSGPRMKRMADYIVSGGWEAE